MTTFNYSHVTQDQSRALADFLEAHAGQAVTLVVNSPGGAAMIGAADAAAVEAHGDVTAIGRGIVASAATLPFIAARVRVLHPAALFMIHNPSTDASGTAATLRGTADALDSIAATYAEFYARRARVSREQVARMMHAETWMPPAEAVAFGFADRLEEATKAAPAVAIFDPTKFRNTPPALLVALAQAKENDMTEQKKIEAETAAPADVRTTAERTRAAKLAEIVATAKLDPTLAAELISEGATVEQAQAKVIEMWAAQGDNSAPTRPRITQGHSFDAPDAMRAKMVAGLTERLAPSKDATAQARDAAQMSIPDIAAAVCRMNGLRPFDQADAVRMAMHSTGDFPVILENSLSNAVRRGFEQRRPDMVRASHEIRRDDYRSGKAAVLSASGKPRVVKEGGEVTFVTMTEGSELLPTPRDVASGFGISNVALTNDATALGLFSQITTKMVQGATEYLRDALVAPLLANGGAGENMADGQPVFHATHGNVAATGAALSQATLSTARTAMRRQRGINGDLLAVEPWALLVPPELDTAAQRLLTEISATKTDDANPFGGRLELIVEPALTSATAWYVIADPGRFDGLAHAYLQGQSAPRVESRQGWSTLGMEFRLVWAFDARFIASASWYRNPGA